MTKVSNDIRLSVHRAMLDEVFRRLRALAVRVDGSDIVLIACVDSEPDDDDLESLSCMEAEVLADFPWATDVRTEVKVVELPKRIGSLGGTMLFSRKEE